MQKPSEMFESVSVSRPASGSYVNGRWSAGADSSLSIVASVQPASPAELMRLPEGDSIKAGVVIFTETALYTSEEATGRRSDVVTWDGREWEVIKVEHFVKGSDHYRVVAVL